MEYCIQAFDSQLDYVFASLLRLGADAADVEDLAHQVFLALLRTWRNFPDETSFRLHLFRLSVRAIARQHRGALPRLDSPDEARPLLLKALDRVPLKRRAVLVLHELDQVPADAIAAGLSMSRLGVAARLRKARRQLVAAIRQLVSDGNTAAFGCLDLLFAARRTDAAHLSQADVPDDEPAGEILQLQDEVFLLETLMDDLPDAIYFKDRDSRFTRINRYAAGHYGIVDPALAVGRTDFDFFTEEHAAQALRDEQQIIRTGQPLVSIEEKETLPDGKLRWVSTTKLPLRDRDGGIVGILGLSHDITGLKQMA
jgi:PAS domain S-box-containing protein